MTNDEQTAREFFVKQKARRSDQIITISEDPERKIVGDTEIGVKNS